MATPATRETLKQYALRALGKPVIEINVDDDQLEDRLDEALQYFAQYHYDGIRRTYLKYQYTEADKTRMTGDSSESVTKNSVTSIRNKNYWNYNSLNPKDPVAIGLFSQKDLIEAIEKAERRIKREKKEKEKAKTTTQ